MDTAAGILPVAVFILWMLRAVYNREAIKPNVIWIRGEPSNLSIHYFQRRDHHLTRFSGRRLFLRK